MKQQNQIIALVVLVAVAAAVWFWVALAWGLRGRWRVEEAPALVAALLGYGLWAVVNFDWVPATAPVWLLAGAAWPGAAAPPPRPSVPRRAAAIALAALGLALAAQPLAADVLLYARQAPRAAALDPLQPRYQAARGDLAGLRQAARLGDPDPAAYVALGDAEAAAGNARAARDAYRRALAVYPYDADARRRLQAVT